MKRLRLVAAVAAILVVASLAAPVAAHAHLESSTPESGAQLDAAPDEITLEYTADVQRATVEVTGVNGTVISGEPRIGDDRTTVRVPLETLGDDVYVVRWEVLASDGHTTSGGFVFAVGEEIPDREQLIAAHEEGGLETSGVEAILSAGLLVGLIGLIGVPLALLSVVAPTVGRERPAVAIRRERRLVAGAALLLLICAGALGAVRVSGSVIPSTADLLGGRAGLVWLLQVAIGGGVLAVSLAVRRFSSRSLVAVSIGGLLVAVSVSATSHSAESLAGVGVDLAHVVAAAAWVGGLVTLTAVVPPILAGSDAPERTAAAVVRRFSVIATAAVAVALTTGLLLAAWHLEAIRSPETLYETTLTAKVTLVAAALGVAGFLRATAYRGLTGTPRNGRFASALGLSGDPTAVFSRTIRIEAAILLTVIVLSGVLVAAPTATHVATEERYGPETGIAESDAYELQLRGVPAEVGPNAYDLSVTREGEPVSGATATLSFDSHSSGETLQEAELTEREPGEYSAVVVLTSARYYDVGIHLEHDGAVIDERVSLHVYPPGGHSHDHSLSAIGSLQALAVAAGGLGTLAVGRTLWRTRQG